MGDFVKDFGVIKHDCIYLCLTVHIIVWRPRKTSHIEKKNSIFI